MADLELVDALTDAPPQIEPDIKRDFISSLEAEPYDDVIGEKCDKTDYVPLLDDDEANGSGDKHSAEGSHPSVVENGEHNTADVGVSDPFGSAGDEDLADFLLPSQVQICPAFPGSTEAAFDEGWLTDSYSKSGDTDTQSADASEKTSATYGETPSDESAKHSFQVSQSDTTSHIWQPTREEKIALSPYSPTEHEGLQLKPEESPFDEASCTESQLLPGLGSTYLEPRDEEELVEPYSYDQEVTSTSIETPDPTTGNNVQESSRDDAAPVLQSVECDQSKEEFGAEQVTPRTGIEPPPSPAAQVSAEPAVSPVESIHENPSVPPVNRFPAEIQAESLGEFHEEASPASPAALDLVKESPASPSALDLVKESPASPSALDLEKESPASPTALDLKKESPASPTALDLKKESPASPAAFDLETESSASPALLDQETESPASPAELVQEAEAVAFPVALVQLEEVPASPVALVEEPVVPVSPVALVQEAAAPSSPIALIQEEEVSASPVALVQGAEAPTSPVALVLEAEVAASPVGLVLEAEVPASPVGLVLEAEVPASPVALVQELEAPVSLNALTKDVKTPASPAALTEELETPSPLTASVQEELASPVSQSPAEGCQQPGAPPEQLEAPPPVRDDQHPGDQGKSEAVAATEEARTGSDITAPPTKELPASPEKKVKALAATATKTAATPKSKPLAAPSPKKPLSSTPIQAKKVSSPAPAATNNAATPKRPLGSALKTATPKEAKPKNLDLKSPVKTPDKKPLTSATTPRSAVKASPAASKLSTSTAANTTGTSAPKPNVTPKRPTSLKNDVKAAEVKKTTSTKSPTELSRPKSVPADLTKSNGTAPASPGRPKTSKPAASKPVTGPSASADAKKQPITRPAPLSKTSAAPTSKPSSALAASRPSAAPKQPRPATAPDLKNVRSKIGSTDNLKHQPGGGKVTSAAKPSIGSSRPPASTGHKPGGANVQILNKKVDVSKVSSKCGSKPGVKAKSGTGDAKPESSKKTETEKKEPQESIKENGGEPITPPQDADLVTPTDNMAVDTRENGVTEMHPVDGSDQRDIQSFNSLIPETSI